MWKSWHFCALGFFLMVQVAKGAGCDSNRSPQMQKLLGFTAQESTSAPLWPNFKFSQHPLFILDPDISNCAHLIHGGRLLESVSISKRPAQGGGFDFVPRQAGYPGKGAFNGEGFVNENGVFLCCSVAKDLVPTVTQVLNKHSLPYALIYWFRAKNQGLDILAMDFSIMVHEAFHFFHQNRGLSTNPWPRLRLGKNTARDSCYKKSPGVQQVLEQEVAALYEAVSISLGNGDFLTPLKEFIRLRKERYRIVGPLPANQASEGISNCLQFEANRETIEGSAQYIGMSTVLQLGLISKEDFLSNFKSNLKASQPTVLYYFTGLAQLMLLERIKGSAFLPFLQEVSRQNNAAAYVELLAAELEKSY